MLTHEAAEHIQNNGGFYTAAKLASEVNISAKEASGLLYNIRTSKKYQTIETALPGRKIKVTAINGNIISKVNLWRLAMFGAA